MRLLESPDAEFSTSAAWALGEIGEPAPAPALVRYLEYWEDKLPQKVSVTILEEAHFSLTEQLEKTFMKIEAAAEALKKLSDPAVEQVLWRQPWLDKMPYRFRWKPWYL